MQRGRHRRPPTSKVFLFIPRPPLGIISPAAAAVSSVAAAAHWQALDTRRRYPLAAAGTLGDHESSLLSLGAVAAAAAAALAAVTVYTPWLAVGTGPWRPRAAAAGPGGGPVGQGRRGPSARHHCDGHGEGAEPQAGGA